MNFIEKIAGDSGEIDTMEKIASYYDSLGRALFHSLVKEAKVAPKAGMSTLGKILAGTGLTAGGYTVGSVRQKGKATEDDVEIANRAYKAGVQRGARAAIAHFQRMGG